MDAGYAAAIAAGVVPVVEMLKSSGYVPEKAIPAVVWATAFIGVAIYVISYDGGFVPAHGWEYFLGWIAASTAASGIYSQTKLLMSRTPPSSPSSPTGLD